MLPKMLRDVIDPVVKDVGLADGVVGKVAVDRPDAQSRVFVVIA